LLILKTRGEREIQVFYMVLLLLRISGGRKGEKLKKPKKRHIPLPDNI